MFGLHVWNVLLFIYFYLFLPVKHILGAASCLLLTFLDSNTQWLLPSSSTWFHHRRPTSNLPDTFWGEGQDSKSKHTKFLQIKQFIHQSRKWRQIKYRRQMGAAAALHKTQTRWRYKVQNPTPDTTEVAVRSLTSSPWQSRSHMTAGGWWRPWREWSCRWACRIAGTPRWHLFGRRGGRMRPAGVWKKA